MKRSSLPLVLVLVLACSGEEAKQPSSQTPPERVEPTTPDKQEPQPEQPKSPDALPAKHGFFMAEGAPEPRACKLAADCTSNTIPDLDNPCCQDPRTLEPYGREYWYWVNEWRKDNCASVTCPPPPPPPQPPECALKLDCVEGVCKNAC